MFISRIHLALWRAYRILQFSRNEAPRAEILACQCASLDSPPAQEYYPDNEESLRYSEHLLVGCSSAFFVLESFGQYGVLNFEAAKERRSRCSCRARV